MHFYSTTVKPYLKITDMKKGPSIFEEILQKKRRKGIPGKADGEHILLKETRVQIVFYSFRSIIRQL